MKVRPSNSHMRKRSCFLEGLPTGLETTQILSAAEVIFYRRADGRGKSPTLPSCCSVSCSTKGDEGECSLLASVLHSTHWDLECRARGQRALSICSFFASPVLICLAGDVTFLAGTCQSAEWELGEISKQKLRARGERGWGS